MPSLQSLPLPRSRAHITAGRCLLAIHWCANTRVTSRPCSTRKSVARERRCRRIRARCSLGISLLEPHHTSSPASRPKARCRDLPHDHQPTRGSTACCEGTSPDHFRLPARPTTAHIARPSTSRRLAGASSPRASTGRLGQSLSGTGCLFHITRSPLLPKGERQVVGCAPRHVAVAGHR